MKNKTNRLSRIFLIAALVAAQGSLFSFEATAETTYTLASPIPSVVNIGTVSEAVSEASASAMWKSPNGQVHYWGGFGDSNFQAHYLNLSTGAHALIHGYKGDARHFAYSSTADKLYMTGTYGAGMTEFDPNTMTARELFNPNNVASNDILIGDDGLVYMAAAGDHLYSYNPALGYPAGWKDYGILHPNSDRGQYSRVAADGNFVYCKVRFSDGHYSLVISPTTGAPNFTEWGFGSTGDTYLETYRIHDGRWILRRELSNGTKKYYHLHDGTYTELPGDQCCTQADRAPHYAVDNGNYFGWQYDIANYFPIRGIHEYSSIKYRQIGAANWNESRLDYPGPWKPQTITTVVPETGSNVFATGQGYTVAIDLDYKTKSINYLGLQGLSPYCSMRHPSGDIYVGGYPNSVSRYDPTKPWSGSNPHLIQINLPDDIYHYRQGMDYDANGNVWIGGNTIRKVPGDYGNVAWYDPDDGTFAYMFPEWKTSYPPELMFQNLVATANRSKIVVSANNGLLYVINAATKTVDGSYNLGESAYMADVNGMAVGVTPGGNIFRFDPVSRTMITPPHNIGVTGDIFGGWYKDQYNYHYKLEKGPDGYLWMFVGNTLYRINPSTLVFEKILDTPYAKIKFSANNTDLLLYGNSTDFKYIPGILKASQTYDASDLNTDSFVNLTDFNILKSDFLKLTVSLTNPKSDINADGQCSVKDVGILMSGWR